MAKVKKNQTHGAQQDLLENPEALAEQISKTEKFLEENRKFVFIIGGAVAVIIMVVFFGRYYLNMQNQEAQALMFQAQYYYEADSLSKAMNGDGNNLGFVDIIDNYPFTEAANLANYYMGVCELKSGEYASAIEYLEKFKGGDLVVQARAYSLIGEAQMELGDYKAAAKQFEKAANYNANEFLSPSYWMKAALAHKEAGDINAAITCYNEIITKYPVSTDVQNAKKYKALLEGKKAS